MNVFFSSCSTDGSESPDLMELRRLAGLCRRTAITVVSTPEAADLILVVDIDEANLFASLRRNPVWRPWPEKSFAHYEGDNPPRFLHGLYSSIPRSWAGSGRFQACAYPLHQLCYANSGPSVAEMAAIPKDLLFSFAGRSSHRIRRQLLALRFPAGEVVVEDTTAYNHFAPMGMDPQTAEHRSKAQQRYWALAGRSKFTLCPRGAGTSSLRLFEMLAAGIAPVIISDDWLPPLGPKWEEFALFVPERELGSLYERVKAHETEYGHRGRLARQAWEQFFAPDSYWAFILDSIRCIQGRQKFAESLYARALPLLAAREWFWRWRIQRVIGLKQQVRSVLSLVKRPE